MNTADFWEVTSFRLVDRNVLEGHPTSIFRLPFTLKIIAVIFSKIPGTMYETNQRHIPEYINLQ
jgi:hypothetical protein